MLSLYLGKHVEYLQGEQVIHIFKPVLNEAFNSSNKTVIPQDTIF